MNFEGRAASSSGSSELEPIAPQKLTNEVKFNLVVAKDVIQQVSHILLQPPKAKKYDALKSRLLVVDGESENRQLQKFLSEIELGDQKPSQLLRHMRDLARGQIPDETLSIMWQGHLPSTVRAVLSIMEELENLAAIADKILETTSSLVAVVTSTSKPSMANEILTLSLHVMELKNAKRSRQRNRYQFVIAPSRVPVIYVPMDFRAKKCLEPCAWKKQNQEN